MVRGLKALLCLVVAEAHRSQKASSAAHSHLAEVLTSMYMKGHMAVTPEVADNFNDAIGQLITTIQTDVQSQVNASFKATEAEIRKRINNLQTATTDALSAKATVDTAADNYYACVQTEKDLLVAVETAQGLKQEAEATVAAPCNLQASLKEADGHFEANHFRLECDFGDEGQCDGYLATINSNTAGALSGMRTNVESQVESWNTAKTNCDAAHALVAQREGEIVAARAAWNSQKTQCTGQHETRRVDMCAFGAKVGEKCQKLTDYQTLKTEINTASNVHSEVDRASVWTTSYVTKCMLEHLLSGKTTDTLSASVSMDECNAMVDYEEQIGNLDMDARDLEVEALTTEAQFSCEETEFTLGSGVGKGLDWDRPTALEPLSGDYNTVSFAPKYNMETYLFTGRCF